MLPETLVYNDDANNFAWFKSPPLKLPSGDVTLTIGSQWEWAHVDLLVLTNDETFTPTKVTIQSVAICNIAEPKFPLVVWVDSPYRLIHPQMHLPKNASTEMRLLAVRNGTVYGAFFVHNPTDKIAHVKIWLQHEGSRVWETTLASRDGVTFPHGKIRIMKIAPMSIKAGLASYDALVPLNRLGSVTIPPHATEGFWLFVKVPINVKPKTYKGAIVIEEQTTLRSVQINVELEVKGVTLPESSPIVTFNWWGYGDAPDEWWDDLIHHGVNAVLCNVYTHVRYRFDEQGNLIGDMDSSRMQKHIEFVKRTRGWLLLEWYLHAPQFAALQCRVLSAPPGASLKFMSEPWKRAFKSLLTRTMQYLKSQGIPSERILHYIFDEYLGERFVQVAELIKGLNSKYRVFADGTFSIEDRIYAVEGRT